ncbi:MAG: tRNA (adenosine(37)-N6)-dimethylallyltransferase MiaA [Rhodospirillales bacterium]|nr:tRNA (adenosine(37)-N6)-dimethylallyltransferase MiaA [Rhodospirillales bacterium]
MAYPSPRPAQQRPAAVVVAGPTGSGKSALALALAEGIEGTIINADSMQVYRDARVLTARPSPADEARAPHRLFGVFAAEDPCTAGRWRALAEAEIAAAEGAGRAAVVVGGTGLYLEALMKGLAPVPPIPTAVREEGARLLAALGAMRFRALLIDRDPQAAALAPGDRQRLLRAWEVVAATGTPLSAWHTRQRDEAAGAGPRTFFVVYLCPPRERLYPLLDARFETMLAAGGLDEARALYRRRLDADLPLLKAVGIRQLLRFCAGETSLDAAIAAARQATRNYAKRQTTWFRHRLPADLVVSEQFSESLAARILPIIRRQLLTGCC